MSNYYLTEEGQVSVALISNEQRKLEKHQAWLHGYLWGMGAGIALTGLLFFLWSGNW